MSPTWNSVVALGVAAVIGAGPSADWTRPRLLDTPTWVFEEYEDRKLQLATSGQAVHAIWIARMDGVPTLFYARSTDCGERWSTPAALARPERRQLWISFTALAAAGDDVHVAWLEGRGHFRHQSAYYLRSQDRGTTWKARTRVLPPRREMFGLQVAARASEVFLISRFRTDRLAVATSTTRGADWSVSATRRHLRQYYQPFEIASALSPANPFGPERIWVAESDYLFIHNRVSGDGKIWADGKAPLQTRVKKSDTEEIAHGDDIFPVGLIVSEGSVDLFWAYRQSIKYGWFFQDIYHQRYLRGDRWSVRRRVNDPGTDAWRSSFGGGGGVLAAAWLQPPTHPATGDLLVAVAQSSDQGHTWRRDFFPGSDWIAPAVTRSQEGAGRCGGVTHLLYAGESGKETGLVYRRSRRSPR